MDPKLMAEQFSRAPRRNQAWVLLLLCAMVLVLFLSGRSILMILSMQSEVEQRQQEQARQQQQAQVQSAAPLTYTVELKDVAVHVMSEDGKNMAYAQFTLVLDCPTPESVKKVEDARSVILNHIFDVANGYTLERLSTAEGKEAFKADLISQFDKAFGDWGPRDVLIQAWVMG